MGKCESKAQRKNEKRKRVLMHLEGSFNGNAWREIGDLCMDDSGDFLQTVVCCSHTDIKPGIRKSLFNFHLNFCTHVAVHLT